MKNESTRRGFIQAATVSAAGLVAAGTAQLAHGQTEAQDSTGSNATPPAAGGEFPRTEPGRGGPVGSATDRGKLVSGYRSAADPPVPCEMPDLEKLPWEMVDGVKEYHLTAQHVQREVLPGQVFDFWGYNGSMPGPLIEAVEGDRVRIVVHNELPEATTVHWHGLELPIDMDGVPGLTQDPIPPGGHFIYEFDLHQSGTFFYHSHGGMQEIMGMSGLFVIHPRQTFTPTVDHDFGLIMQEFSILPQSTIPNTVSEEFSYFTINGRSGPYVTPMVVRLGSRVRIRFMNMSAMDHHPMHMHGHTFWVTGTEGGRIPESAWIPTNNVIVAVGQSRDVEFIANNPGDWMLHCHILHHMMNHMVSMVGPMANMDDSSGMPDQGATPQMEGHGMASGQLGAGLQPSLGPTLSRDRAIMTGMRASTMGQKSLVPGYPQDMMDMGGMLAPGELKKLNSKLTRGMRRNWPMGVMAMMTVIRVLPDELYNQVVSTDDDIEPGASVPGGGPGKEMGGGMEDMSGMEGMSGMQGMHNTPDQEKKESPATNDEKMPDMKMPGMK